MLLIVSSRTTCVSWLQKDKPFWLLMKQEMIDWQWHQLDQMRIIYSRLTDNHASITYHSLMSWVVSFRWR